MEIPIERPANADETHTTSEIAVLAATSILVAGTVVLRYFGRRAAQTRSRPSQGRSSNTIWGLDDLFNVLAVLSFYGLIAAVAVAVHRGMGTHITLILYEHGVPGIIDYNQAIFVCAVFYNTVLGMVKLSVLCLYLRIIQRGHSQPLRVAVWAGFVLVAANTLANVTVAIFQCWPIKAAWDVTIHADQKRCVQINAFYLGNASTGVTTDIIVYLLSIPIIWPLQLEKNVKAQLLATMLVGGFAVVTSGIRLSFIPALLKNPDASMAMGIPMIWSVVEPAVAILASSGPAIRPCCLVLRKPGKESYGSGAPKPSNRSQDYALDYMQGDVESGASHQRGSSGNESEEQLFVGNADSMKNGHIVRATEIKVSYGTE